MNISLFFIKIFYFWLSYNVFNIKTHGNQGYKISAILFSISLAISPIITYLYCNEYFMVIPLFPFLYFIYKNHEVEKRMKKRKKIYMKK